MPGSRPFAGDSDPRLRSRSPGVFLAWCGEHGITSIEQLDQRSMDRFTSWLHTKPGIAGRTAEPGLDPRLFPDSGAIPSLVPAGGETVKAKPQLPRLGRRVIDVLSGSEIKPWRTLACGAGPTDHPTPGCGSASCAP